MPILEVKDLTKDYGSGRGVFDVSLSLQKGEVYGFLGPNGAGKTTTIRHIMGFSRPQKGFAAVNGLNSWQNYDSIQKDLGYLPGEIALPDNLNGNEFIKMMADLRGMKDMTYTKHLIKEFDLDPKGGLKRMSLGMKRKLAIVTAFMHDPQILVLDEPTSGLDPIMQEVFIDFIKEEKRKGKTILLSSHMFTEVDATCDRISIIKEGRIVTSFIADDLRHSESKTFKLEFKNKKDFEKFQNESFEIITIKPHKNQVKILINDQQMNTFISIISNYDLKFFTEIKFTLEDYFMKFYDSGKEAAGGEGFVTY